MGSQTMIAILSPAIAGHTPPAPPMDVVAVFGFFAAFLTLVVALHHTRRATLLMAVCLTALAIYGFMVGAWPAGFVLLALSAGRVARWRRWPAVRRTWTFYAESNERDHWSAQTRVT